jgi:hypothetical protein
MTGRTAYAAAGGVWGLAWSAGLRGWMVEISAGESTFTWMTFLYILAPGVVVGAVLGLAAHDRAAGRPPGRWFVLTPLVFAAGLVDPRLLWWLLHTGESSGALLMALAAMCAGYALIRRRWTAGRVAAAAFALLAVAGIGALAMTTAPLSSPRGAWVAVFGASHLAVLCLAATLTYRPSGRRLDVSSYVAVGALCGLAWASVLRSLMVALGSDGSTVGWLGTVGVLAAGAVTGALLGWAEFARRSGRRRHVRLLVLAPLIMATITLVGIATAPAASLDALSASAPQSMWVALLNGSLLATLVVATALCLARAGGSPREPSVSRADDVGTSGAPEQSVARSSQVCNLPGTR